MTDTTTRTRSAAAAGPGAGGAVYGLGLIGALVWFWSLADSFGDHVLAVLKAIVWPALLVYRAFKGLG